MRISLAAVPLLALVAACGGRSNEEALEDAANQSDPAAAAVLENAAENGMDPQQALQEAGNAQVEGDASQQNQALQARPNLPQQPNRPEGGEPPQKVAVPTNQ